MTPLLERWFEGPLVERCTIEKLVPSLGLTAHFTFYIRFIWQMLWQIHSYSQLWIFNLLLFQVELIKVSMIFIKLLICYIRCLEANKAAMLS